MILYYAIFFLVVATYFITDSQRKKSTTNTKDQLTTLAMLLALMAIFVGVSDMLGGYDRYIYCQLADEASDDVHAGFSPLEAEIFYQYPKEQGYGWYTVLLGYIAPNRYIFILITTFVIYALLFVSIKDYCSNYPFAVIVFLGLWFFFTFTYLRQVMGATIAWLSIRYIVDRKLWKFLLIWFIAYKFHNSALIFLPLYFLPIKKFQIKWVALVMLIMLALGVTGFPSALFAAYGEVDAHRTEVVNSEVGSRLAYMIEAAFFLLIIFSKYKDIPEDPKHLVLLNMALVFCGILLFFIKNDNGGRLAWYYMIGVISTTTYLCTHTVRNKDLAVFMVVVCFFLFNRILSTWGVLLYPYKTFFTDGIRKNDFIEEKYEYDHNYDINKFYRPALWFMKKDD